MIRERLEKGVQWVSSRMLRMPRFRNWYARRLVKLIDRSKKKRRPLTGNLPMIERTIRGLPKPERAKAVARMLEPMQDHLVGRDMRRAAQRQERASGKGSARRRPGTLPQRNVQRRPR